MQIPCPSRDATGMQVSCEFHARMRACKSHTGFMRISFKFHTTAAKASSSCMSHASPMQAPYEFRASITPLSRTPHRYACCMQAPRESHASFRTPSPSLTLSLSLSPTHSPSLCVSRTSCNPWANYMKLSGEAATLRHKCMVEQASKAVGKLKGSC